MKDNIQSETTTIETVERSFDGCVYQYRLFSRALATGTFYSVSAEMITRENTRTSSMVYDAFSDPDCARAFFYRLSELLVTPIDLPYVLEDEIGTAAR